MDILILISVFTVLHKKDIKCRIYEDDVESWVLDINNTIQRKENKTIVINCFSDVE
jgi:hypothetical protein